MSTGFRKLANFWIVSVLLCILLYTIDAAKFDYEFVTCGSVLKLLNTRASVRLHSHDVKYGSGSGQQSVTAVDSSDDHNSYWQVQPKMGGQCTRGNPVKCGQTIRLQHVTTQKNLHSHHFQSPLSRNQEVSAFGDGGEGDEGDHWAVTCSGKYWSRTEPVRLKHVVTEHYLHVSGDTFGRPIHGQREVSAYHSPSDANLWQAMEGIFVKPNSGSSRDSASNIEHDEF
ncbi:stromal cell-derived factor 2-like isoform X2 [Lingula anatina]|uniref:Stromal cell-derived factor 2-like isoform X1 n=1 Tax=Lingula anatina TaxID=7574 RepID=A0A1S3J6M3_LINAN|nr:stromal cell-derived factor 2-like isoform X1 [Lingula anatina]XP_013405902.1 stromal cell-derived factor 2-like isoform X2 [Lingula anatina]|eukprot:XP_013405901.1 stromal cell-derived factor 2-like isoform X1 [Lingula anatina]